MLFAPTSTAAVPPLAGANTSARGSRRRGDVDLKPPEPERKALLQAPVACLRQGVDVCHCIAVTSYMGKEILFSCMVCFSSCT